LSEPHPRLWSGRYVVLLIATFLVYVGFQMLVPTFTTHIRELGGSDVAAGAAYSLSSLAALLARGGSGNAMDGLGRKPTLLAGLVVLIVINVAYHFVADIRVIWLTRFIQGVGWGMASTALATMMSDLIPLERMGEGVGYFALSIVLATSVSVILGIRVMEAAGFPFVIALTTAFFLIGLVLCVLIRAPAFHRHETIGARPWWTRLLERRAMLPALLCFLHSVAFSGIMAFIMLFGRESGIENVWVYFIGHLTMIVVSRPLVGRLFDKRGHAAVIIPGVLMLIAGLLILSFARSVPTLVLASCCYGLGFGSVQPSLQAWAIKRSPRHRKGAANGTFLSSIDLGYAGGVLVMGSVASWGGYATMYRAATVPVIALLIILVIAVIRERRAPPLTEGA